MTPVVVDASVAAIWAFDDEDAPVAEPALAAAIEGLAVAPRLFWYEARNMAIVGERRKRLTPEQSARFVESLAALDIAIDDEPDERVAFMLARRHGLTFYDACYLELAMRMNAAMASLDRALLRAASAEGVPLLAA
ncbi:MAG: type II toxin-antitoxin system VapC family toxin [Phyllobacteriaceae bacterium]|nr:type II toxin-antitoxin system VapC family toxin [Phyllobacteriaceae bacterium]